MLSKYILNVSDASSRKELQGSPAVGAKEVQRMIYRTD